MIDKDKLKTEVSRLDGILYGISCFSGGIREYLAESYFLFRNEPSDSIQSCLRRNFGDRGEIRFPKEQRLTQGLGELEKAIRPFLVRGDSNTKLHSSSDFKAYLAFRIMDQIDLIADSEKPNDVTEVHFTVGSFPSAAKTFCIGYDLGYLVLSFLESANYGVVVDP